MTSEIRVNKIANRAGLSTVEYTDTGIIVSGIVTATELSGLSALNISGVGTATTLDINGDIDVDGHTNLDNLSVAGVSTFSSNITLNGGLVASSSVTAGQILVGSGVTIESNQVATGQATFTGIVTASSFRGDGSQLTGITQTTINSNTNNYVVTATGTANTLQGESTLTFDGDSLLLLSSTDGRRVSFAGGGTSHYMKFDNTLNGIILNGYGGITFETNGTNERLRIDSSGRLLAGTTDIGYNQFADNLTLADSANCGITLRSGTSNQGNIYFSDGTGTGADTYRGMITYAHADNNMLFATNSVERLRIHSNGKITIGTGSRNTETTTGAVLIDRDITAESDSGDPNNYHLVIRSQTNSNTSKIGIGFVNTSDDDKLGASILHHRTGGGSVGDLAFYTSPSDGAMSERLRITSAGHVEPATNDTYDLGTTGLRWANLYVNDLQLSNEAKKDEGGNDVDGTWGDWTLQEGENDIFMINKRNGKKFKINMTEVS